MDATLAQLLTKLFELQLECQRQEAHIAELQKVIASKLPVQEVTLADLQNGEMVAVEGASNDHKG